MKKLEVPKFWFTSWPSGHIFSGRGPLIQIAFPPFLPRPPFSEKNDTIPLHNKNWEEIELVEKHLFGVRA